MPNVKEYFESILGQEIRLQCYQHQVESMEKTLSPFHEETMAKSLAVLREWKADAEEMEQAYQQSKQEAEMLLAKIPPESAKILKQRYWEKKTMPEISKGLFLSERQAYRWLEKAEAEFQTVLDERELQNNAKN